MSIPTTALTAASSSAVRLCRRLHSRIRAWYLAWLLADIRKQLDRLEAAMAEATNQVVDLARLHRHSPAMQGHRQAMRAKHETLAKRWLVVRRDLDTLEGQL